MESISRAVSGTEDMTDYLARMSKQLEAMEAAHSQTVAPRRESLARATALYLERKASNAESVTLGTAAAPQAAANKAARRRYSTGGYVPGAAASSPTTALVRHQSDAGPESRLSPVAAAEQPWHKAGMDEYQPYSPVTPGAAAAGPGESSSSIAMRGFQTPAKSPQRLPEWEFHSDQQQQLQPQRQQQLNSRALFHTPQQTHTPHPWVSDAGNRLAVAMTMTNLSPAFDAVYDGRFGVTGLSTCNYPTSSSSNISGGPSRAPSSKLQLPLASATLEKFPAGNHAGLKRPPLSQKTSQSCKHLQTGAGPPPLSPATLAIAQTAAASARSAPSTQPAAIASEAAAAITPSWCFVDEHSSATIQQPDDSTLSRHSSSPDQVKDSSTALQHDYQAAVADASSSTTQQQQVQEAAGLSAPPGHSQRNQCSVKAPLAAAAAAARAKEAEWQAAAGHAAAAEHDMQQQQSGAPHAIVQLQDSDKACSSQAVNEQQQQQQQLDSVSGAHRQQFENCVDRGLADATGNIPAQAAAPPPAASAKEVPASSSDTVLASLRRHGSLSLMAPAAQQLLDLPLQQMTQVLSNSQGSSSRNRSCSFTGTGLDSRSSLHDSTRNGFQRSSSSSRIVADALASSNSAQQLTCVGSSPDFKATQLRTAAGAACAAFATAESGNQPFASSILAAATSGAGVPGVADASQAMHSSAPSVLQSIPTGALEAADDQHYRTVVEDNDMVLFESPSVSPVCSHASLHLPLRASNQVPSSKFSMNIVTAAVTVAEAQPPVLQLVTNTAVMNVTPPAPVGKAEGLAEGAAQQPAAVSFLQAEGSTSSSTTACLPAALVSAANTLIVAGTPVPAAALAAEQSARLEGSSYSLWNAAEASGDITVIGRSMQFVAGCLSAAEHAGRTGQHQHQHQHALKQFASIEQQQQQWQGGHSSSCIAQWHQRPHKSVSDSPIEPGLAMNTVDVVTGVRVVRQPLDRKHRERSPAGQVHTEQEQWQAASRQLEIPNKQVQQQIAAQHNELHSMLAEAEELHGSGSPRAADADSGFTPAAAAAAGSTGSPSKPSWSERVLHRITSALRSGSSRQWLASSSGAPAATNNPNSSSGTAMLVEAAVNCTSSVSDGGISDAAAVVVAGLSHVSNADRADSSSTDTWAGQQPQPAAAGDLQALLLGFPPLGIDDAVEASLATAAAAASKEAGLGYAKLTGLLARAAAMSVAGVGIAAMLGTPAPHLVSCGRTLHAPTLAAVAGLLTNSKWDMSSSSSSSSCSHLQAAAVASLAIATSCKVAAWELQGWGLQDFQQERATSHSPSRVPNTDADVVSESLDLSDLSLSSNNSSSISSEQSAGMPELLQEASRDQKTSRPASAEYDAGKYAEPTEVVAESISSGGGGGVCCDTLHSRPPGVQAAAGQIQPRQSPGWQHEDSNAEVNTKQQVTSPQVSKQRTNSQEMSTAGQALLQTGKWQSAQQQQHQQQPVQQQLHSQQPLQWQQGQQQLWIRQLPPSQPVQHQVRRQPTGVHTAASNLHGRQATAVAMQQLKQMRLCRRSSFAGNSIDQSRQQQQEWLRSSRSEAEVGLVGHPAGVWTCAWQQQQQWQQQLAIHPGSQVHLQQQTRWQRQQPQTQQQQQPQQHQQLPMPSNICLGHGISGQLPVQQQNLTRELSCSEFYQQLLQQQRVKEQQQQQQQVEQQLPQQLQPRNWQQRCLGHIAAEQHGWQQQPTEVHTQQQLQDCRQPIWELMGARDDGATTLYQADNSPYAGSMPARAVSVGTGQRQLAALAKLKRGMLMRQQRAQQHEEQQQQLDNTVWAQGHNSILPAQHRPAAGDVKQAWSAADDSTSSHPGTFGYQHDHQQQQHNGAEMVKAVQAKRAAPALTAPAAWTKDQKAGHWAEQEAVGAAGEHSQEEISAGAAATASKPFLKRKSRNIVVGGKVDWSNVQSKTNSRLDNRYVPVSKNRRGSQSGGTAKQQRNAQRATSAANSKTIGCYKSSKQFAGYESGYEVERHSSTYYRAQGHSAAAVAAGSGGGSRGINRSNSCSNRQAASFSSRSCASATPSFIPGAPATNNQLGREYAETRPVASAPAGSYGGQLDAKCQSIGQQYSNTTANGYTAAAAAGCGSELRPPAEQDAPLDDLLNHVNHLIKEFDRMYK